MKIDPCVRPLRNHRAAAPAGGKRWRREKRGIGPDTSGDEARRPRVAPRMCSHPTEKTADPRPAPPAYSEALGTPAPRAAPAQVLQLCPHAAPPAVGQRRGSGVLPAWLRALLPPPPEPAREAAPSELASSPASGPLPTSRG